MVALSPQHSCSPLLTPWRFLSRRPSRSLAGWAYAGLLAFLLGSLLASLAGCGRADVQTCREPSQEILQGLRVQAETLLDAIEDYAQSNGTWPASLEDLIPKYIDEIPTPNWGERHWRYRRAPPAGQATDVLVDVRCSPTRYSMYFFTARLSEDGSRSFRHWGT